MGFAVSEAGTVADAIAGLEQAPQWVLLDLMLPDGSGLNVLRKVRSDQIAARVCIITGCDSAMLRAARLEGAEHTFTKPLDVARLMTVMCA
jgi:DNA-binding response OmpR family regulator